MAETKKKKTQGRRGNREGSIYQRKDGRWCCQVIVGYKVDGTPDRKYIYGKTRQEVAEKLTKQNHIILNTGLKKGTKKNLLLKPALMEWFETFRIVDVESSTVEGLFYRVRRIINAFGEQYIDKITLIQCQKFFNELNRQYSIDYVRRVYSLFNQFMIYARKQKWIEENPLEEVVLRKKKNPLGRNRESKPEEEKALTPEIRREFFACLEHKPVLKPMVYVSTFASLRPNEIPPLRWKHFDEQNKTLGIIDGTGKEIEFDSEWNVISRKQKICDTKNGKARTNEIPDILVTVLKQWKQYQMEEELRTGLHLTRDNDFIFPTQNGTIRTYSSMRSMLQRFLGKYNLPSYITLYTFRHTFATMLLENKENPKIVQELMGHCKVELTLGTYSHVIAKATRTGAANTLDAAFNQIDVNYTKKEPLRIA